MLAFSTTAGVANGYEVVNTKVETCPCRMRGFVAGIIWCSSAPVICGVKLVCASVGQGFVQILSVRIVALQVGKAVIKAYVGNNVPARLTYLKVVAKSDNALYVVCSPCRSYIIIAVRDVSPIRYII